MTDLERLSLLFTAISKDQQKRAIEWSTGPGAGVAVDYVRGYSDAFAKAAAIINEKIDGERRS